MKNFAVDTSRLSRSVLMPASINEVRVDDMDSTFLYWFKQVFKPELLSNTCHYTYKREITKIEFTV